ncbi:tryptophan synthase subunit alpha [Gynuella sunshinyii]|uniref:Tryptophan synthase alpha chain n=1 Tax=Gynuella sunshinyii YC6258 TaxID=1445510 RepID=A0A0C5V698_9GAMM|nr:tryptophan synthase subunit alpha [Gynuella sunshinyii]AJQ94990.1 tryptophan synthase alpha chain [Gynuella sunshinyii YC6258]
MKRIESTFGRLQEQGRQALIPFITCGDPRPEVTLPLMHGLVEQGADILELGIPFSDPMADGPAIQLANERSLSHGTGLKDVLSIVREFRDTNTNTPVVLMGYMNPIEFMGYENFAFQAQQAGVDGLITVDLPPEECDVLLPILSDHQIDPVFLLTPTTSKERAARILSYCSGYVYYVSLKGVTGSNRLDVADVAEKVAAIKALTDLPVAVGFGIKDPESAQAVARVADGAVVGSVLVNKVGELQNSETREIVTQVAGIIGQMRTAMDQR